MVSEAPPEFATRHAAALARLHKRAGSTRWTPAPASMTDAAFRAARAAGLPDDASVDAFIDTLAAHGEDLSLAIACRDGNLAAWEHFITTLRPLLYGAARAIAGDEMRGLELADSLWAEMYGLEVRDGRRRSVLDYFHGRSSLPTWMRVVLAQRHIDYIRSQSRMQPIDNHSELHYNQAANSDDPVEPERARYVAMLGTALDTALKALAPRDRLRLGYYYRHNLSLKEIGRALGEHESTVSRKLAHTREHLKREIELMLRDGGKLSQDQIRLCYDFAVGDLQLDLARALPDIP